ncbi:pilus assembly protein TadE [Kocuria rosea subsp. polaris]|uniref:Pilus assembly protein TadE n=1 Tax=Kocuria rosea subsp. polaris TaxID=136273 RepID=A0A0W8IPU2_KOCRO|nr:TadE family protein [Kocuria polaris]KUG61988.1 pilus assembly protein TadE [Kocuria polaris]
MSRFRSERGAVAVEFALAIPLLLTILLGIVEMGFAFNSQISVTHAAREAVRTMAVQNDAAAARATAMAASPSLFPALTAGEITVAPATCTAGSTATVTIQHNHTFVTGFFGAGVNIRGTAAMQCGG